MGNFIVSYVVNTIQMFPSALSGYSSMSGDQKVIAVYIDLMAIIIYHYDQILRQFVYHSTIPSINTRRWSSTVLKLNGDGLRLVVSGFPTRYQLHYYTRPNLTSQFSFIANTKFDPTSTSGFQPAIKVSYDGQVILVKQKNLYWSSPTSTIRVFSCGATVVEMNIPPNGIQDIYQSAYLFQEIVYNATINDPLNRR